MTDRHRKGFLSPILGGDPGGSLRMSPSEWRIDPNKRRIIRLRHAKSGLKPLLAATPMLVPPPLIVRLSSLDRSPIGLPPAHKLVLTDLTDPLQLPRMPPEDDLGVRVTPSRRLVVLYKPPAAKLPRNLGYKTPNSSLFTSTTGANLPQSLLIMAETRTWNCREGGRTSTEWEGA